MTVPKLSVATPVLTMFPWASGEWERDASIDDVAQIAELFGGGGHRNASGCTLDGPLPVALEQILTQLRTGL